MVHPRWAPKTETGTSLAHIVRATQELQGAAGPGIGPVTTPIPQQQQRRECPDINSTTGDVLPLFVARSVQQAPLGSSVNPAPMGCLGVFWCVPKDTKGSYRVRDPPQ